MAEFDYDAFEREALGKLNGDEQDTDHAALAEKMMNTQRRFTRPPSIGRLSKNVSLGVMRAALNTVEAVDDVAEAGATALTQDITGDDDQPTVDPVPPLQTLFPGVFESLHSFIDEQEKNNTVSDDLVTGVAQFGVPFMGYLKAVGGVQTGRVALSVARVGAAEGTAAATAFEPDEGRIADLVDIGRQMENGLGALLNDISPEGSAVNSYIDYMTSREGDTAMEGRFKNAVDSLVGTGAIATLLKTAGVTARVASKRLKDAPAKPRLSTGDTGERTVSIAKKGEAVAQENDQFLQMKRIDVLESERGTGAGMDMILRMAKEAKSKGLTLASDVTVSPSAVRLYEGLERRGFTVKKNPATTNPNTGSLISKDPRVPVFEVTPPTDTAKAGAAIVATGAAVVGAVEASNRNRAE